MVEIKIDDSSNGIVRIDIAGVPTQFFKEGVIEPQELKSIVEETSGGKVVHLFGVPKERFFIIVAKDEGDFSKENLFTLYSRLEDFITSRVSFYNRMKLLREIVQDRYKRSQYLYKDKAGNNRYLVVLLDLDGHLSVLSNEYFYEKSMDVLKNINRLGDNRSLVESESWLWNKDAEETYGAIVKLKLDELSTILGNGNIKGLLREIDGIVYRVFDILKRHKSPQHGCC